MAAGDIKSLLEETVARVRALCILRVMEVPFEMSSQCYRGVASHGGEGMEMLTERTAVQRAEQKGASCGGQKGS